MTGVERPEVLLLDGDYDNTLPIAKELSEDLDARVIGAGTNTLSRLFFSRYCDEKAIVDRGETYAESLLSLVEDHRPDVVLPVGCESVVAVDEIRERMPDDVRYALPPPESLEVAIDKRRTTTLAATHGITVPEDYTDLVDSLASDGDTGHPPGLPRPLILKGRRETGDALTSKVEESDSFWEEYAALSRRARGEQVLVQDCVTGDGRTYGCGLLMIDGSLKMLFDHVELRSVPRHGGAGTRLRVFRDPHLEAMSVELLEALDWHGVALVEYRRSAEGYTLMEINPKFWASYALASQCGYRFASTLVAELVDRPRRDYSSAPAQTGERVFPLRELTYCLRNAREESIRDAVGSMLWPPARWDVDLADLPAWLMPPTSVTQRIAPARASVRSVLPQSSEMSGEE